MQISLSQNNCYLKASLFVLYFYYKKYFCIIFLREYQLKLLKMIYCGGKIFLFLKT